MSANLIAQMHGVHCLQDDLESTIYVLLWITLMYSDTSDRDQVPLFLSGVLDPQPRGHIGGYGKADFLKARTFLQSVHFPGRPALHRLIDQLARLFAVRYEAKPTLSEETTSNFLKKKTEANPDDAEFVQAYHTTPAYLYHDHINKLNGHQHTIDLFDEALRDRAAWPPNDFAIKQDFKSDTPPPLHQVTKTGWDTTFFVHEMDSESHESNVVEDSNSSCSEISEYGFESDEMTVDGDDKVGNLLPICIV